MSEFRKPEPQGKYQLQSGFQIEFDPTRCLPPDEVSEKIGKEAARAINLIRFSSSALPIRILGLGVGSGITEASTLDGLASKGNTSVHGIDIDNYSVNLTQQNLARLVTDYKDKPNIDIQRRDWFDPNTWSELSQRKYHIIHFNPPFLPPGEQVRPGYEATPRSAMYADDIEGLSHYQYVLPRLIDLLSEETGSTIFIRRRPPTDTTAILARLNAPGGFEPADELSMLVNTLYAQMPHFSFSEDMVFDPNRKASWFTISRTNGWGLPLHQNPLISAAQEPDPAYMGQLLKLIAPVGTK